MNILVNGIVTTLDESKRATVLEANCTQTGAIYVEEIKSRERKLAQPLEGYTYNPGDEVLLMEYPGYGNPTVAFSLNFVATLQMA